GLTPVTHVVSKPTPIPPQQFWLYYGILDATAPSYDLTLVAGELLKAERGTIAAGVEENLSPKPAFVGQKLTRSTRYIFLGALALVVILLLTIMSRFLPRQPQCWACGSVIRRYTQHRAARQDYEKRVLAFLPSRQACRGNDRIGPTQDGRDTFIRNVRSTIVPTGWWLFVLCLAYFSIMIFGHLQDRLILFPTRSPI